MRALAVAALLATLLPASAFAGSDTSMRCPGGIISLGDATIDLLGKCGAPALREVRAFDTGVVGTVGPTFGRAALLTSERWSYDFGPQQFLMFVTVEGGKVVAIERGSYGYARGDTPVPLHRATCDTSALRVGDSKIDLLARCGEPVLVELRKENVIQGAPLSPRNRLVSRAVLMDVEVWTYDFGPQSFVRFVVLDDGVVTRIDTGSHGYAR